MDALVAQRAHFTTLCFSVDGSRDALIGVEAASFLRDLFTVCQLSRRDHMLM